MSEVLTINTTEGIFKEEVIEPYKLLDENHPFLKQPIPEYKGILPSTPMDVLVKRLKMTMKLYGGIGLSANQCGVQSRVFVLGVDDFFIACINPKVVDQSPNLVKDNEGCLSFPGLFLNLERPEWIEVEFAEPSGDVVRARLDGITARCYLHELDHMNGVRFVEHAGPTALNVARRKQQKLIKKVVRKQKNGI
jgi:peptide deformylase